jgi:hypothetical protein
MKLDQFFVNAPDIFIYPYVFFHCCQNKRLQFNQAGIDLRATFLLHHWFVTLAKKKKTICEHNSKTFNPTREHQIRIMMIYVMIVVRIFLPGDYHWVVSNYCH